MTVEGLPEYETLALFSAVVSSGLLAGLILLSRLTHSVCCASLLLSWVLDTDLLMWAFALALAQATVSQWWTPLGVPECSTLSGERMLRLQVTLQPSPRSLFGCDNRSYAGLIG